LRQRHRLCRGGGLVQQRGVGDFHAGKVGAQRLEVDQRLHAALRNFRLIRRIRGVPGRVLQDIAQDDVRRMRAVIALADEAAEYLVLVGDGADLGQRFDFGDRGWQRQRRGRFDRCRHDRVGHRVQRRMADHMQHLRDLGIVGADMALDEGMVMLELAQRGGIFMAHD
jgi:hypothetical protein